MNQIADFCILPPVFSLQFAVRSLRAFDTDRRSCVYARRVNLSFFFQVPLRGDYKRDVEDVKETAIKMLSREYSYAQKEFHLINGYRRVDPRRGAEYILDIGIKNTERAKGSTVRCVVGKHPANYS